MLETPVVLISHKRPDLAEQVLAAIVLEDDTVPDSSFFDFCSALLQRYREDADQGGVCRR